MYASAFMNNSLNSLFYFRIQNTLLQVGPAVFYGGLSTLLAVVLLAASDYYPFVVFFKVGDGNEIFCKSLAMRLHEPTYIILWFIVYR